VREYNVNRDRNALIAAALAVLLLAACSRAEQEPAASAAPAPEAASEAAPEAQTPPGVEGAAAAEVPAMPTTLQIVDQKVGAGPAIANGQTAVVQYTGWLFDQSAPEQKGTKFDSSRDRDEPFSFELGQGHVIAGWDQGVAGMQVGGQRRLVIPAELGYGQRGAGAVIPPGATLVFDVELVAID
jgi:FKBP-type peptidyl-prolyl cis-trans isomerase FkpA